MLEQDSVCIRGYPLLGRRVKVVRARVVLICGLEGDEVLLETPEDGSFLHQPPNGDNDELECHKMTMITMMTIDNGSPKLVSFHHAHTFVDVPDDFSSRLFKPEVKIAAPEDTVIAVKNIVLSFQWQHLWEV